MAWREFVEALERLQQKRNSDIALVLNPRPSLLPHPIQRYDDPYLPFGRAVINTTRDSVCAYVFDLAAYLGIGAAGAIALERTIAYAAQDTLTILHGPFTGTGYAATADSTGFGVDAITLTRPSDLPFYLNHPPGGAFLMTDTEEIPAEGGIFLEARRLLLLYGTNQRKVQIRLTGDDVLYAGGRDDFAEKIRAALEQMQ